MERATVSGEVAETYHRLRPRYPNEMFDDLFTVARLSIGSTVLEIGCGTGIATHDLVRRGLVALAIDPDQRMLAIAAARTLDDGVQFMEGRFEDYSAAPSSFALVFAAGSWHWVDTGVAIPKAAALLRGDGSLAVCWNLPRPQGSVRPDGLDAAYRALAPELVGVASQVVDRSPAHRMDAIVGSGLFSEPVRFAYRWERSLSTDEYCELLSTHSDHRMLGAERLAPLLAAIRDVVEARGGRMDLSYETVMFVARLRRG